MVITGSSSASRQRREHGEIQQTDRHQGLVDIHHVSPVGKDKIPLHRTVVIELLFCIYLLNVYYGEGSHLGPGKNSRYGQGNIQPLRISQFTITMMREAFHLMQLKMLCYGTGQTIVFGI